MCYTGRMDTKPMTDMQLELDQSWLDSKDPAMTIELFPDEIQVWLTEIELLKKQLKHAEEYGA